MFFTDLALLSTAALLPLPPTYQNNQEIIGTRTAPLPALPGALNSSQDGEKCNKTVALSHGRGDWLKHHPQASLSHPWVPRRDKESVHKDDVVLGYVTHLAYPLLLSFRTPRVIRDMNETFQGPTVGKPAQTHRRGLSDLPKDMQLVPEAGIPTMDHPCSGGCHHP